MHQIWCTHPGICDFHNCCRNVQVHRRYFIRKARLEIPQSHNRRPIKSYVSSGLYLVLPFDWSATVFLLFYEQYYFRDFLISNANGWYLPFQNKERRWQIFTSGYFSTSGTEKKIWRLRSRNTVVTQYLASKRLSFTSAQSSDMFTQRRQEA